MPAQEINGKKIAEEITQEIKQCVTKLSQKPGLAVILVGNDEASHLYVKLKKKACEQCDIQFHRYLLEQDCDEQEILDTIKFLNTDDDVHGILVQLPLPKKFNTEKILNTIDPEKDVDAFHAFNIYCLKKGKPTIIPGLALSVQRLLKETQERLSGKKAIIISNSPVFAEPIEFLLKKDKITAQYCAPDDKQVKEKTRQSDIIIVAVGKPNFIKESWVKKGAIIIDVGINKLADGTVVGDVCESAKENAGWITPVPGGVGPMTVAMLLFNTYLLAKKKSI